MLSRRTSLLTFAVTLLLSGCGAAASVEPPADSGTIPADAASSDAVVDADPTEAGDETGPWGATFDLVGVGSAVGEGVLGPVYPMGVWADADQVVVVGLARAAFVWGGLTVPAGGFVVAIEASTGKVRWHRTIGESVNGVAASGEDLAIAGSFSREITLAPTSGGPIVLKAPGVGAIGSPSDGYVAVITRSGTFKWARRFGSTGYDHAFGVATSADSIAVTGAISGTADLGEGCAGKLEASPAGDDGDGHPLGPKDAVVLRYGRDGSCPWGAVLGAPAVDDLALGVVMRDGALFVTGDSARPMRLRTTTGDDRELGGPPSKGTEPFLVRLDPEGARPSTWFLTQGARGGRGRTLAMRGADLLWGFTVPGESALVHEGSPERRVSTGGHVLSLRDDLVTRVSDVGETTLDIGSIAVTEAGVAVVGATEFEPHGVVLARIDATSTSVTRHKATAGYPFAAAAHGADVWIAGYSGIDLEVGSPPTKIAVGPEGGLFLLHTRP